MERIRKAAIWCRVSTNAQLEQSVDSQEAVGLAEANTRGLTVSPEHVFKVDWSSMDLASCPQFTQLRQLVTTGAIQAIVVLDRDRLQAQGLDRLVFLAECKEHGVEIITVQGAQILESGEGQLVELALALGKERSVRRSQQGAKDGLRDRARLRGLPPSPNPFFGYRWDSQRQRFTPTEHHSDAREVWRLGLLGMPISKIAEELTNRGIDTPGGSQGWWSYSVRHILKNSAYAGVIQALKTESVAPQKRTARTYGKSSRRSRPEDERIRLEGLVEQPIITEQEYEWMQERLRKNKQLASKNTKLRFYLLKGMIRCAECGRTYGGSTSERRAKTYSYYACGGRSNPLPSGNRCESKSMNAGTVEETVFRIVSEFLRNHERFETEVERRQETMQASEESLSRELAVLDRQAQEEVDAEATAFRMATHGMVSSEVFDQEVGLIRTRQRWIDERRSRIKFQLDDLRRLQFDPESVQQLRNRLANRLESASDEDRRFVLEALGANVIVQPDGAWELEIQVPQPPPAISGSAFQAVESRPGSISLYPTPWSFLILFARSGAPTRSLGRRVRDQRQLASRGNFHLPDFVRTLLRRMSLSRHLTPPQKRPVFQLSTGLVNRGHVRVELGMNTFVRPAPGVSRMPTGGGLEHSDHSQPTGTAT